MSHDLDFKISLKKVRLSFPELFTAVAFEGNQVKKFQATALIDAEKQKDQIAEIKKAIRACAEKKWGAGKVPKSVKPCLHDGEEKDYDGYEGMMFINTSNKIRPHIVDRDGRTPLAEEDGQIYAGCYVNISFNLWAQDNQFGKRVNASLIGVQFVSDGDAFGAVQPDVEDVFDAEPDSTEAEDDFLS